MRIAELVDFGSTFTKVRLVDLDDGTLLAAAQAPTTASTHLLDGFAAARALLGIEWARRPRELVRASSSAAGGLRMVAVGLVPALTLRAARTAAMGAGARVVGAYGYRLTDRELAEIEALAPDILLLAGGTDGGDTDVVLHNAKRIADSTVACPVIMAGNKDARDDVVALLRAADMEVHPADNVLPELDRLAAESSGRLVRDIFAREIVRARGLADAAELAGTAVVPTPLAVLRAAEVLAAGAGDLAGLGDLMVVDVGGATTDVHSVAEGRPTDARTVVRGIPEPHAKRTVEGDLGIRVNAPNVAELLAARLPPGTWTPAAVRHATASAALLAEVRSTLPGDPVAAAADDLLTATAVHTAVGRHVGRIETTYGPRGPIPVQEGKDLTAVTALIGTGGVFGATANAAAVLAACLADDTEPALLRPAKPTCYVDRAYCLFAVGLLAEPAPHTAVALGLSKLVEV
jgi:uncharacterized protein (TIGR01319 family)